MPTWITSLFKPVASLLAQRGQRKAAKEAAVSKLTQASADNAHALELKKDEWEALNVSLQGQTWKDEYITVSVVSIFNLVLVGGIATAFGYPQILNGVGIAVQSLVAAGVDVGFLLEATILAGLGLSVWKKF